MEKKIFWIVAAVSVFLLVIFGAALLVYWPSRSTGESLRTGIAIPSRTNTGSSDTTAAANRGIDPDAWVRDPNSTPGMDSIIQPVPGNINLTIVNGDNAGANYGQVDVSGLTRSPAPATGTPPQDGKEPLAIPGQTTTQTGSASANSTGKNPAQTQTTVKSTAQGATPGTAKAAVPVAKPAVTVKAPAPLKTVTDYWIQTGSFTNKLNAEKARETLSGRHLPAEIFTRDSGGNTAYRVRVGPYSSKTEAEYWLGTVTLLDGFATSYVSEVKTKK